MSGLRRGRNADEVNQKMKNKLLKVKEKYNLDYLDMYRSKDTIGSFETDNFLRLIIGKNNTYFMRDMEDRIVNDEVFDKLTGMIPEMIIQLNEIIEETDNEKQ